jgi:hypothetical protein
MADLDGIKKRIALVDLNLQTAHSKRERESQALMETWEQIRQRFQDQKSEMVALRTRVSELEDSQNVMQDLIQNLLSAVEGGLESMADETVPKIKDMASAMLEEDNAHPVPRLPVEIPESGAAHNDFLTAMERTDIEDTETVFDVGIPLEPDASEGIPDQLLELSADLIDDSPTSGETPSSDLPANEPASPGIRRLIERLEETVIRENIAPAAVEEEEEENELDRDLREIEDLRSELLGLRDKIASDGRG